MLINIENVQIRAELSSEKFELPLKFKQEIEKFWDKASKENTNLWNGEQICVSEFKRSEEKIMITCKKSDYAHYLYDERIGLPIQYACSSLVAGCLLETSDGYYIVGELANNTSYPHCLQISGGSCDDNDIMNGKINIFNTIQREVQEELNINLQDINQVEQCKIKYINLPSEKAHTYILFAKGILKMNMREMEEHYKTYLKYLQDNNGEVEFDKIHFIRKGNVEDELRKFNNPKREYLEKLLVKDNK